MNRINPKRLKEARASKKWSRQKLADKSKVSYSRIARIETSKTNVSVQETTANYLAKTLKVSVQALSSDKQPVRGQRSSPPKVKINPKRLKEARASKKWSRQKLADKSRVSYSRIARIETSKTNVSVQETTANYLAKTLKVSVQALSSDIAQIKTSKTDMAVQRTTANRLAEALQANSQALSSDTARIGTSKKNVSVQETTANHLAKALQVSSQALSSDMTRTKTSKTYVVVQKTTANHLPRRCKSAVKPSQAI